MGSKLSTIATAYSLPGFPVAPSVALAFYAAVVIQRPGLDQPTVIVCRADNLTVVAADNRSALTDLIVVQPRLGTKLSVLTEALRIARDPHAAPANRVLRVPASTPDRVVLQTGADNVPFAALMPSEAPEVADIIDALDAAAEPACPCGSNSPQHCGLNDLADEANSLAA